MSGIYVPEKVLPPEYMQMLAVFARTNDVINIDLQCRDCKQYFGGANATHDNHWRMACGCRVLVGKNPTMAPR